MKEHFKQSKFELKTERLTLRPIRLGDEEAIHEYAGDKGITMMFFSLMRRLRKPVILLGKMLPNGIRRIRPILSLLSFMMGKSLVDVMLILVIVRTDHMRLLAGSSTKNTETEVLHLRRHMLCLTTPLKTWI